MGILSTKRTKETYRYKIKSQASGSQEGHLITIDNFEKFSMETYGKVNLIPDLLEATNEEVIDTLQKWINWNSERAPSTIAVYFSRLRKYLHYMGIKLDSQDVKNELEFKHKIDKELYGLTLDDIKKIFSTFDYNTKVQYMCQLSSLMRIGEIVQLRKKHLVLDKLNIVVRIPTTIAKFNKGRTTYFSKESSLLLRPKLRRLDDNDLVFGSNENPRFSVLNVEQKLRRAIIRIGLDMRYEDVNRFYINTHSFRAYGITKLSRYDPNFAKKIAGQKGYLLQYDRMSDEDKLEIYQKYEDDLIIDDSLKQKQKITRLETEQAKKIEKYEERFEHLEDILKRLSEKTKDS